MDSLGHAPRKQRSTTTINNLHKKMEIVKLKITDICIICNF